MDRQREISVSDSEYQPKVLYLCLPGIGDSLLTLPALEALKRNWPQANITALTMFAGTRDILALSPAIDEILHFPFLSRSKLAGLHFAYGLRKSRFDYALLSYPSNRWEYNLLALLSGARSRLGHRYQLCDRCQMNWLNHQSVREHGELGNIAENLLLVELLTGQPAPFGSLSIALPEVALSDANEWIASRELARPLMALHSGGSTAKNHLHKRWPPALFIELGKELQRQFGATVLVFGGPDELEVADKVSAGIGGRTVNVKCSDFLTVAGILKHCKVLVSNDTALLHLAGALGVPAVGIFGPTNAAWVRIPGAPRIELTAGLPCQPCFRYSPRHLSCRFGDFRCLPAVTVASVMNAIRASGFLELDSTSSCEDK